MEYVEITREADNRLLTGQDEPVPGTDVSWRDYNHFRKCAEEARDLGDAPAGDAKERLERFQSRFRADGNIELFPVPGTAQYQNRRAAGNVLADHLTAGEMSNPDHEVADGAFRDYLAERRRNL